MAIVLAAFCSLFIGLGEIISARQTTSTRPAEITVGYFAGGLLLTIAALASGVLPSVFLPNDLVYGALSGLFNGFALVLLYSAYSVSSVGVALPTTGMVSIVVPVVVDLAFKGTQPSGALVVGAIIGTGSLGLTSFSPDLGGRVIRGAMLAVGSGLCYGAMLILLAETTTESGLWPVLPQRVVSLGVAVGVARSSGPRAWPPSGTRLPPALAGAFGALGLIVFALAAQRGSLSVVSVVGSQYAAVAIIGGLMLGGPKVWWWQVVGLVGSAVGVSLVIIG